MIRGTITHGTAGTVAVEIEMDGSTVEVRFPTGDVWRGSASEVSVLELFPDALLSLAGEPVWLHPDHPSAFWKEFVPRLTAAKNWWSDPQDETCVAHDWQHHRYPQGLLISACRRCDRRVIDLTDGCQSKSIDTFRTLG